ncbi:unnamed protein product [Adineta steineri]|uniref:ubiquitinyl hydrolase 1 n=1 Tax=Adineta steineri TaxID=433720 RepID=A0A815UDB9_9BILA|nr:unnamed protein product [Adineta steineri]CAF1521053.1 unnamed protein product [Adineta steineri]
MNNTIEYPKAYKASRQVNEIRDVPESHYVCQWWIQHFDKIEVKDNPNSFIQFKKKHRDQIRWNRGLLPFRRSGLWMTIKVVLHTILIKRLGDVGTIVYKLLITDFLTHIICTRQISTDLLVHCVRKIVRRLDKIEDLLTKIETNNIDTWIQLTKQNIALKVNKIMPKPDWQKITRLNKRKQKKFFDINFNPKDLEIYEHSCLEFKIYLKEQSSNTTSKSFLDMNNHTDNSNVNQIDYIPSIEVLTKQFNYTINVALTRVEIWIESHLEEWINRPITSQNENNRYEVLLHMFEEYQNAALNHYWSGGSSSDPIGYSRFILASLMIIRSMHQNLCKDPRFERLKSHSIVIPDLISLFEYLTLPTRDDMIKAYNLYIDFSEFSRKIYPDLLADIKSVDAFGIHYARQSPPMNDSIQAIRIQAEQEKQEKIKEIEDAKQSYIQLINSVNGLSCECVCKGLFVTKCKKCKIEQQAEKIQVKIFECPIPAVHENALAVIFELQMPIEIRCYRDVLWQFINRPRPVRGSNMCEWLKISPHASKLGPHFTSPRAYKVKLISPTNAITQTHYSHPPSIASASVQDFLFENSLQIAISPIESIQPSDERRILTPQLNHSDYKQLQFTLDTTQFVQNQVIAQLSDCPLRLKPTQFVEFGSFRSGHRLQWWNLLPIFEIESLPIADESIVILITHSILQYGPLITDQNLILNSWCTESHQELLEDHFVDELISRLNHHLNDCELNWQNELVLVIITMITMRILTICNPTKEDKTADLARKCRKIGEKWVDLISATIQTVSPSDFDEVNKLRLKLVNIGLACLLTFSTHPDRIRYLLSSNEHVVSLLKAATTIHDNILLNRNPSDRSTFMGNIMRFSERVLVILQPTIAEHLQKTAFQSLNDFVAIYWSVIKTNGNMNGQWKKRYIDTYDGWYDCQYDSRLISIDCIQGTFLVDGMTIGFLPSPITSNKLFIRVFASHIFEVQQAELPYTYITKHSYHDGRVLYEFYFNNQSSHLIIKERHIQTNHVFQLIPHHYFEKELSDTFVSNYSHWWNTGNQQLQFRSIHFQNTEFLDNTPYVLNMDTGRITTTETGNAQVLVNQVSAFFRNLFAKYFVRLDDKPYVYMMSDHSSQSQTIIHIHLSRLGIAFRYNSATELITSREYSDMRVDVDQWLGTLTGLTSGLLLSPLPVNNQRLDNYPYRKLIVPFGEVESSMTTVNIHQTVTIRRTSVTTDLLRHYFVFILNDRLNILQSTDSPAGWLYLSLLHAKTSNPLPDEYTKMTGMERAFQLLNSAGCSSDQPFDALSLNILAQIASISPNVNYYPQHLQCMVKIEWISNELPYSMQHFGYYLITKKLISASHQLNFMYPSLASNYSPEIFRGNSYDETLLKKLYWDYRDSYNPIARLSADMEADIQRLLQTTPYQPHVQNYSSVTDNRTIQLVDGLYSDGNVNLIEYSLNNWLPLSQWWTAGYALRNIWVGLLKLTERFKQERIENIVDDIGRFEILLDFFYYNSDKLGINPFYLQMLQTALKAPTISLTSIEFPLFKNYQKIGDTSVVFRSNLTSRQEKGVKAGMRKCLEQGVQFIDYHNRLSSRDVSNINRLLRQWSSNIKLQSFLIDVQSRICAVSIKPFRIKVPFYAQKFEYEQMKDRHQIYVKSNSKSIDRTLLKNAKQTFHQFSSDHFNKTTIPFQSAKNSKAFPQNIFPSNNDRNNSLSELTNYFKKQLSESWEKLVNDEQIEKKDPSAEEIFTRLNSLKQELTQSWNELINSITSSHERLFESGVVSRITPTTLISLFQQKGTTFDLTNDQRTLLGGILVNWTLEQQLERVLYFIALKKQDDFKEEILNMPHSNWVPSEHIPWLILELEMNITIREIQIKVARHMMQLTTDTNDKAIKNIVMQMNMGEGKTSVILPMLALSLSSFNSSLVRIIVLKSLFPTNYQSLRYKLGGLLNRRIFPFVCRRDLNFSDSQIQQIDNRFRQGLENCDVVLTSPEDILSFDLLTIDKCQREDFAAGRSMLILQRWLKAYTRDVLDESDEILHVKYQLIYTVGTQQQVDGGSERWIAIQSVLDLVKKHATQIANDFSNDVCYKSPERTSAFPQFRLQSHVPFPELCKRIANAWLDQQNFCQTDKELIISFVLEIDSSIDCLMNRFSKDDIQLFLIIRGLLSSEVLLIALKKRYRVNYGLNPNLSFNRLIAVPFRAKDVAADRTEFGHPDIALVLTHLTYYYSGLNDSQLTQCFDRLNEKETDPASIYDEWISREDINDIPTSIKHWKGVNLKDYQQRTHYLFPTLRYNMLVINYFLNYFVFLREAKQFPHKLVATAWDLSSSSRSKIITGFSGTNDTQLLLPIHIRQYDLPELQKTDAIVVNNLLQPENESYRPLPINVTSMEILELIIRFEKNINVILDVGALFVDGTNRDIAMKWLNLSDKTKIDYVVYFDSDSIVVCDRQSHLSHPFVTSSASERLDRCVFYLDEIHTRGTDFKFPKEFRAIVTLGNGLTKDRFVQACMRMRKLGNGHSLAFWSSYEVHQQITTLKTNLSSRIEGESNMNNSNVIHILRWVYENTVHATWDGLHHWALQSSSFQRKIAAFQSINWNNFEQLFLDKMMAELARECLESEIIELAFMYGAGKALRTVKDIHIDRYRQSKFCLSSEIKDLVLKRLIEYGGTKQRLSQLLDEEQQRELEQELEEERQLKRLPPAEAYSPILHQEIKRLSNTEDTMMDLTQFPNIFRPLPDAFIDTTFHLNCQSNSWSSNLWITTEFQRIITTKGEPLDSFLRTPRWLLVYRNQQYIFVNALEANWLIGRLRSNKSPTTTLRLLLPRIKKNQSILVNTSTLTVPPLINFPNEATAVNIPFDYLVQLFIFNGTLFFDNVTEQTEYCQCLRLCPKPRTEKEEKAFEKRWIDSDGFISDPRYYHHLQIAQARFKSNPLAFIKQVIDNRNNSHVPLSSHVGSIIFKSLKLIK